MTHYSTIVIRPSKGWARINWGELWTYHELIFFLAWREVKVRYKQTVLGVVWAVLQPFFTMVIFYLVFSRLAAVPSDGLPYPIFSYCALMPWQLFAYSLTEAGNSVVANRNLITKVYFPRLVIPISTVLAGLVDFMVSFVLFIGMMGYFKIVPTVRMLALPFFVALAITAALSVGIWMSALNVRYRDVRYTIPFLIQAWLLATPIAYPTSLIPETWRPVYGLNPMALVVEGFRWALLGTDISSGAMLPVSLMITLVILVSGIYYFRRTEARFSDTV